jgi:hypothetical protein
MEFLANRLKINSTSSHKRATNGGKKEMESGGAPPTSKSLPLAPPKIKLTSKKAKAGRTATPLALPDMPLGKPPYSDWHLGNAV